MSQNLPSILDADAERLASEPVAEVSHFVFRLAGRSYGLPTACVDQVTAMTRPVPIPTVPPFFLGVVHLRGRLLTVVDLAAVLGLGTAAGDDELASHEERRLLVVRLAGHSLAFVVDGTLGVVVTPAEAARRIEDPDRLVSARLRLGDDDVTILLPDALLASIEGAAGPSRGAA